jgi:hypothetical protein
MNVKITSSTKQSRSDARISTIAMVTVFARTVNAYVIQVGQITIAQ